MTTYKDSLSTGQQLNVGDTLASYNNTYQLVLQADGNLVLTRLSDNLAIWKAGPLKADLLKNVPRDQPAIRHNGNNIQLYNSAYTEVKLSLGDDGNLVLWMGSIYIPQRIFWESNNNTNSIYSIPVPYADEFDKAGPETLG